jgi:hypothetical protein
MAATRVAMPAVPPPAATVAPPAPAAPRTEVAERPARSRSHTAIRGGGLRRAVVITGLIALGAGGYAAWVDPDIADRIPQDVKASIKRALPSENQKGAPPAEEPTAPAEAPREQQGQPAPQVPQSPPQETRIVLSDKPIVLKGGLKPLSPEDIEAEKAAAAAAATEQAPDAAPPVAEGVTGESPDELRSPEDLAAAGSPDPDPIASPPVRPGAGRRVTGPAAKPRVERRAPPYEPVDATTRVFRYLQKKQRRDSIWSPPRDTDPVPPPRRSLNPGGAPILP